MDTKVRECCKKRVKLPNAAKKHRREGRKDLNLSSQRTLAKAIRV